MSQMGLGKKKVVFENKDGDHYYLIRHLEQVFPKLIPIGGGFLLYKASVGGGGSRQLTKLPMGSNGYTIQWLRGSCNITSSSTIYIVPVQTDLDMNKIEVDDDDIPSTKCCKCNKYIPISKFEWHTTTCQAGDEGAVEGAEANLKERCPSKSDKRKLVKDSQVSNEEVSSVVGKGGPKKSNIMQDSKVCSTCKEVYVGNICVPCERKAGMSYISDDDSEKNHPLIINHHQINHPVVDLFVASKELDKERDDNFHLGDDDIEEFFADDIINTPNHLVEEENPQDMETAISDSEFVVVFKMEFENFEALRSTFPPKTICIQRSNFWKHFFRNKFDLSKDKVFVNYAGEKANTKDVGPYKEFLRISMEKFSNIEGNILFGAPFERFFTADPLMLEEKRYFLLGQLSAVAILTVARGPECFHDVLVRHIFAMPIKEKFTIDDAILQENLRKIDEGNLDILYECDIPSFDMTKASFLYVMNYAIYKRSEAIYQFINGIKSISEEILRNKYFMQYFKIRNACLSERDILDLLCYHYAGENGSNERVKEEDCVFELELLITQLGAGEIEMLSLKDFLIFITTLSVIPPCGFHKKIDVYFRQGNFLPTASTCGLIFTLPHENTRDNIIMALKEGNTFEML